MFNQPISDENFTLFAAHKYQNPACASEEEFYEDLNRVKYIKRLFFRFDNTGELKVRLLLNHIIIQRCYECGVCFDNGLKICTANNPNEEEKEEEKNKLCSECVAKYKHKYNLDKGKIGNICQKHDIEHAIYKCDSCCGVASFCCSGYYCCKRCHDDILGRNKDNMYKVNKYECYPCPGPEKCPFKFKHPKNENIFSAKVHFVLGCKKCK